MAKTDATLLVVLVSFTGQLGGRPCTFQKGKVIESDHPAVRAWPDKFGPLTLPYPVKREAPPIEQATSAPGEKRGR
jgi:hypothetical protein